ncbi:phage integrase N-terminal SAM-like domain-containing protein, partial [Rubripirellula obstinata]
MSKSKRFNPSKSNPSFFPESLRKRLSDDLQLQGMADRTVKAYVRAVRQLAEFLKRSPEEVCDDHIREYFLHLKNDRR